MVSDCFWAWQINLPEKAQKNMGNKSYSSMAKVFPV